MPPIATLANNSATAVKAAVENTFQRPDATSAKGKRMPSCGLTVRSPISTPATTGRSSRQAKIASSAAVVSSELWPGQHAEQRRGRDQHDHQRAPVCDLAAAGEIEGKPAHRKPGEQRREISEQRRTAPSRPARSAGSASSGRDSRGRACARARHYRSRHRRSARDQARTTATPYIHKFRKSRPTHQRRLVARKCAGPIGREEIGGQRQHEQRAAEQAAARAGIPRSRRRASRARSSGRGGEGRSLRLCRA